MALTKKADGRYYYSGPPGGGVILTGPAAGSVTLANGNVYDVTPEAIEHLPGDGSAIAYHIAKMHEASGKLTDLVHGPGYDGPHAIVVGDETGHSIGHEGDV